MDWGGGRLDKEGGCSPPATALQVEAAMRVLDSECKRAGNAANAGKAGNEAGMTCTSSAEAGRQAGGRAGGRAGRHDGRQAGRQTGRQCAGR